MATADGVEGGTSPFDALEHDPASWLAAWVDDPATAAEAHRAVRSVLDTEDPAAVYSALRSVRSAGPSERGNPADPLLRKILRAWLGAIVTRSEAFGVEQLRAVSGRPTVIVSNHLSYVDTTATECVLLRAGARALADRLAILAGPKVWDTPLHAIATCALNIVPTVQAQAVAGPRSRDAAGQLLRAIALARDWMAAGSPLLVYPEGTRSRTGRMGSFLRGVQHYLAAPDTVIVPVALYGTDALYPIAEGAGSRLHPGPVSLGIGGPIEVVDPVEALEESWAAVARMLPAQHRPAADTPPVR